MKKNLFKSALMLFAAGALITSCSEDEVITEQSVTEEATVEEEEEEVVSDTPTLKVIVKTSDFTGADAETRATESSDGSNDHTTYFEADDQIGVYLVTSEGCLYTDSDGNSVDQNIALEYDGSEWKGTLTYVADAYYMAYYPYSSTAVTDASSTVSSQLQAAITIAADQSSAYHDYDLMEADAVQPTANTSSDDSDSTDDSDYTVTFSFSHSFSMIEIVVPQRTYYYTDSKSEQITFTIGDIELVDEQVTITGSEETEGTAYTLYNPSEITDEVVYRCIIEPGTVSLSFSIDDDGTEYDFSVSSLTLTAGYYKRYTLSWDGSPSSDGEAEEYTIQVGDYVYSDGTIYTAAAAASLDDDETIPNAEDCVGIVFSTETSTTDRSNGWTNGYVVALGNVYNSTTYSIKWAGDYSNTAWSDELKITDESSVYTDYDGYTYYTTIAALDNFSFYSAFYAISTSYTVDTPTNSSGWYLPSIGQLASFGDNLSGTTILSSSEFNSSSKTPTRTTAIATIEAVFSKAGGYFEATADSEYAIDTSGTNLWWTTNWGLNSSSTEQPVGMIFKTGDSTSEFAFLYRGHTTANGRTVRPVFAF